MSHDRLRTQRQVLSTPAAQSGMLGEEHTRQDGNHLRRLLNALGRLACVIIFLVLGAVCFRMQYRLDVLELQQRIEQKSRWALEQKLHNFVLTPVATPNEPELSIVFKRGDFHVEPTPTLIRSDSPDQETFE